MKTSKRKTEAANRRNGQTREHSIYYLMHARLANMIHAHDTARYQKSNSMKQWKICSCFQCNPAHKIIPFSLHFFSFWNSCIIITISFFFYVLHEPMLFIQFTQSWVMHNTYASTSLLLLLFWHRSHLNVVGSNLFVICAVVATEAEDDAVVNFGYYRPCDASNRSARWKSIEKTHLIHIWKLKNKLLCSLVVLLQNFNIFFYKCSKRIWVLEAKQTN